MTILESDKFVEGHGTWHENNDGKGGGARGALGMIHRGDRDHDK